MVRAGAERRCGLLQSAAAGSIADLGALSPGERAMIALLPPEERVTYLTPKMAQEMAEANVFKCRHDTAKSIIANVR